MAKSFSTLKEKMSPEACERAGQKAGKLIEEDEVRVGRKLTQEKLADYVMTDKESEKPDPEFAPQMEAAERVMNEDHNALRKLAE
jgi:hypothetical protein